jgi:hypothetical protein
LFVISGFSNDHSKTGGRRTGQTGPCKEPEQALIRGLCAAVRPQLLALIDQPDFAQAVGVGIPPPIVGFEKVRYGGRSEFIDENGGGPRVRLRKAAKGQSRK